MGSFYKSSVCNEWARHGVFVKEMLCVKSGSRSRWNLGNLYKSVLDGGLIKNKTSLVLVICLKSTAVNMVIYRV